MEKVVKTINELCVKITDGAHNSPVECSEGSYKMYSSKDMTYNSFDDSDVKLISKKDYQKLANQDCQPQKNDILIIKDGANYLKYVFKVQETIEAVILSSIAILRPNQKIINPDYFVYLLRTASIRNAMSNYVSGAAIPRIVLKDFKKMKLDIVSNLSVQKSISSVLLLFDNLIEVNNKRIKTLEQMAENLYKEWFVRFRFPGHETTEFENGIPKGWKVCKLFSVAKVQYGYAFASEQFCDDNTLNPVVRIRDVPNNKTKTYTGESCDNKYLIAENAILVGMDGIFHMCLWSGGRAFLNQRVVQIQSDYKGMSNYYLFYAIAPQVKFWEQVIAGTTVAHLGDKHLKKMSILIPEPYLLEKASSILDNMLNQKNRLLKENDNLIKQRDLLLPRLMSGKLEV